MVIISMAIDILFEASQISKKLNEEKIDWAFVGGLAVAIHGFIRATNDIDIIIKLDDLKRVDQILELNQFVINKNPIKFSDGFICFRRAKFDDEGNFFMFDILIHDKLSSEYLSRKVTGKLGEIDSFVICKDDLISMKKKANRPKDKVDIESIQNET